MRAWRGRGAHGEPAHAAAGHRGHGRPGGDGRDRAHGGENQAATLVSTLQSQSSRNLMLVNKHSVRTPCFILEPRKTFKKLSIPTGFVEIANKL